MPQKIKTKRFTRSNSQKVVTPSVGSKRANKTVPVIVKFHSQKKPPISFKKQLFFRITVPQIKLTRRFWKSAMVGILIFVTVIFVSLQILSWQRFNRKNEALLKHGEYQTALANYEDLSKKIPLWFIKQKITYAKQLVESADSYSQGIQAFSREDYTVAGTFFRQVIKDDIHYNLAQQKLTEITRIELFKQAQTDIDEENIQNEGNGEIVVIPERDSLFEPRPENGNQTTPSAQTQNQ